MSFNEKTIRTLEFDKICELLKHYAETEGAVALIDRLSPSSDYVEVKRRLARTTDAVRLSDYKGAPGFGHIRDITGACERADKGAVLSMRELLDCADVLRTARGLSDYYRGNHPFDTVLDTVFERLIPERRLEEKIYRAIISEEMIADEASPELADIRRKIRNENAKIRESLQKMVASNAKYLQENIITTRNGRYVIPVKAECKAEVKGLIHDTSSTGATIFIEPMAVVDANNEIRILKSREEAEIERILSELSADVAGCCDALWLNYRNVNELAFVFACASLSISMKAIEPKLSTDTAVNLIKARHPLIDKEKVVPVNISLGKDFDTLIITGPNTGGKTVTLKTLGLFALMTQAGLHIPCEEGSCICLYDDILVDLGDEQSIEQSLSTFSSHMVNIVSIIRGIGEHSLVLFDELGGGTDPVEGAALAIAIIEAVRKAGACCMTTTHYAELKAYALDTPGVCNASCEFDVETLHPTYKLIIGAPGKSNAFAISEKLGLPREIIERANSMLSDNSQSFERVIGQLDLARTQMEKEKQIAEQMRREYEAYKKEAEAEIKSKVDAAEQKAEQARQRATTMIAQAKASCDYVYEQMDKMRKAADSKNAAEELEAARRAVREHLRANESTYEPVKQAAPVDEHYVLPRPLKKGDRVLLVSMNMTGVLTDDPKGDKVSFQSGVFRTKAKLSDLRLTEGEGQSEKKKEKSSVSVERSDGFKPEIDLRGMYGDEAWLEVDKYIDSAQLRGIKSIRLIHGKGTGALKNALWKYLRNDKRVSGFRLGQYGEGDGGVTVVELK